MSELEHLHVLNAPRGDHPRIQSENLLVFKAPHGDNPQVQSSKNNFFKAPPRDDPQVGDKDLDTDHVISGLWEA